MKYKIIRAFGGYFNFSLGEIREFTEAEAIKHAHSIELINSESVNSTDIKPNKMYKKGDRKMKKLLVGLIALSFMIQGMPVFAAERGLTPYSVAATTYPVTDPDTIGIQITGTASIHHILITTSDSTIAQTVTFYENATDSTTVTTGFTVSLPSSSAAGYHVPLQIPFPIPASALELTNLCVRKSSLVSEVRVVIFYR